MSSEAMPANTTVDQARAFHLLRDMLPNMRAEDRVTFFRLMHDGYCYECGEPAADNNCQCWNDE